MSYKINKLAVILAGDFRLWDRAADYIFKFADDHATNVEYYFATWSTTRDYWWPEEKSASTQREVTEQDILEKFQLTDRNLVDFKIIDQSVLPRYSVTIYYQSYLANVANLLKRKYEFYNNFVYDQVIEIRPDLYLRVDPEFNMEMCSDFEYSAGITYKQDTVPYHQLNDFYSRSSSFSNDIISKRYYNQQADYLSRNYLGMQTFCKIPQNNHWILLDYLYSRRLISITERSNNWREFTSQIPIRPNFPTDLDQLSFAELNDLQNEWIAHQWK